MNLSKVVGNFVEEQKAVNVQENQRIDTVESTLNKRLVDNLQYSISRLTNQQQVQEKGKFPSQTQPNSRGVYEIASSNEPTPKIDEVKAVITLRSGKQVEQPMPIPIEETKEEKEVESERIVIKEDMMKKSMPPPFPQALRGKKKVINQNEILEVLRQVKVNIPLLYIIKQVPTYAKFLKDLCTIKRGLSINKKPFLTE